MIKKIFKFAKNTQILSQDPNIINLVHIGGKYYELFIDLLFKMSNLIVIMLQNFI